jgi:tRNA(Ile)-lysidine synthase
MKGTVASLLDRVSRTLSRYNMLPRGSRAGVAVSGGADSVALLFLLKELSHDMEIELVALHLNHCLRGAESDQDAAFVGGMALDAGLAFHGESQAVANLDSNLEQAARNARLDFFRRAMRELNLQRVATGHTLDDQAETVLLRLARGSGWGGITGVLPITAEGLVRPLLDIRRAELRAWLEARRIPWREDSSNLDLSFSRNKIRQLAIPALEAATNPKAVESIGRLAAIAYEEEAFWRDLVEAAFRRLCPGEAPFVVQAADLAALAPALARRLVRRVLQEVSGSLRRFTLEHADHVLELAHAERGHGRLKLPGVDVRRSFGELQFAAAGIEADPPAVEIRGAGIFPWPSCSLRLQVVDKKEDRVEPGDLIDASRLTFPLKLRAWRPGDSYVPRGKAVPRTLKEMFQKARIPSWNRRTWPIIEGGDLVVWSRRFGPADWAAAGEGHGEILRVTEIEEPRK